MDRKVVSVLVVMVVAAGLAFVACDGGSPAADAKTPEAKIDNAEPKATELPTIVPPAPAAPGATLLMASAQFVRTPEGKPKPGPALLTFWTKGEAGWSSTKLEDPDSNVFHKAKPTGDGGFYTIGAEGAFLKKWTKVDGNWTGATLWNPKWEGKWNRIRDLEIGDVNGDGKDDLVMATHDFGVIGVGSWAADGTLAVTELNKAADTFVHEIEICDVDGDGQKEFFATPSARNQSSGKSQPGKVVMFKWDGAKYQETVLDDFEGSHAKEILCADVDGGGPSEFFSVVEAETELKDGKAAVKHPVEIRQYRWKGAKVEHTVIATIDDKQTRFLVPGDFDQDGKMDLIAAAMKSGLWHITQKTDGTWGATNIDANSSGFEHATWGADLDGDKKLELYVAADEQKELRQYVWNPTTKSFDRTLIGAVQADTITWNITSGVF